MRRSTVLSLLPQLVFPAVSYGHKNMYLINFLNMIFQNYFETLLFKKVGIMKHSKGE